MKKPTLFAYVGLIVLLLVSLFVMEWQLTGHLKREVQLATNIGRILHLDEILTMSALMAASSQNSVYERRYYHHEKMLEETIEDTLQLVATKEALDAVASTDEANQILVEIEHRSFKLGKEGKWEGALALLESEEYLDQKEIYLEGMKTAFDHLESEANSSTILFKIFVVGLQLVILVCAFWILRLWKRSLDSATQLERKEAENTAFRATMHTVNDMCNNALNSLMLIKLKAKANGNRLKEEDLDLFDGIINNTSEKLASISNLKEVKTKSKSGFEMLDIAQSMKSKDENRNPSNQIIDGRN